MKDCETEDRILTPLCSHVKDCIKEVDVASGSEKYLDPAFFLMTSIGQQYRLQKDI